MNKKREIKWVKDELRTNGFTYKKNIIKKKKYIGIKNKIFEIIFKPNLIKKGFYNDNS